MKKTDPDGKKTIVPAPHMDLHRVAAELRGPATRQLGGKALRKVCSRSSHAEAILGQGERDALALIEDSDKGRLEHLLPIRFTRMVESPFAFFRGSAIVQ